MINLDNADKILIIRLSSLGDVLLTTPLIRTIKTRYQKINIDFIIKPQYIDAVKYNPYLNSTFRYEDINDDFFARVNNDHQYDLVIDLQNNYRSNQISGKINAPVIKFQKRNLDKFLLVHFKINRLKNAPPIPLRYIDSVKDFQLDEKGLDLFIPGSVGPKLNKSGKYVGLCPGSRHYTKMWPEEYFIKLGNTLSDNGYNVILFGGKTDREICKKISDRVVNAKDYSNDDDLLQTAADMKECLCIICNDSGLMHAASAVQTPVIAIFGSTVKEFGFVPYKNKNLILENNLLSCRPCSHIGRNKCPKGHFNCMKEILPSVVYEKFVELIDCL